MRRNVKGVETQSNINVEFRHVLSRSGRKATRVRAGTLAIRLSNLCIHHVMQCMVCLNYKHDLIRDMICVIFKVYMRCSV